MLQVVVLSGIWNTGTNSPSRSAFNISAARPVTSPVNLPHLSFRSMDPEANPDASHHFVTDTWQRGEPDTDVGRTSSVFTVSSGFQLG